MSERMQWEYLQHDVKGMPILSDQSKDIAAEFAMCGYGEQGWELVNALRQRSGVVSCFFKRPKVEAVKPADKEPVKPKTKGRA